jgi:hypothetical protein
LRWAGDGRRRGGPLDADTTSNSPKRANGRDFRSHRCQNAGVRNLAAFSTCAATACVALALSGGPAAAADGFWGSVDVSGRYGPTDGFFQTPKGGTGGTTDVRRPSVEDLELEDVLIPAFSLGVGYGSHGIVLGGELLRLNGHDDLERGLTSYDQAFPSGTPVESEIKLDWYYAAYGYRFQVDLDTAGWLAIEPQAGVALWTFDYSLEAADFRARRAYEKASPLVGLTLDWRPLPDFDVQGRLTSTVPVGTAPLILAADVTFGFRLWGSPDHGGRIYAGAGYEEIDYEDAQTVPNHIRLQIAPVLLLGLRIGF